MIANSKANPHRIRAETKLGNETLKAEVEFNLLPSGIVPEEIAIHWHPKSTTFEVRSPLPDVPLQVLAENQKPLLKLDPSKLLINIARVPLPKPHATRNEMLPPVPPVRTALLT